MCLIRPFSLLPCVSTSESVSSVQTTSRPHWYLFILMYQLISFNYFANGIMSFIIQNKSSQYLLFSSYWCLVAMVVRLQKLFSFFSACQGKAWQYMHPVEGICPNCPQKPLPFPDKLATSIGMMGQRDQPPIRFIDHSISIVCVV